MRNARLLKPTHPERTLTAGPCGRALRSSSAALAQGLVEADARGDGDVRALDRALHRQAHAGRALIEGRRTSRNSFSGCSVSWWRLGPATLSLGVGDDVEHADAGTQDGHDAGLAAADRVDLGDRAPAVDAALLEREVGRRLVGQQAGQPVGQPAELLGRDVMLSQQPDLCLTRGCETSMTGMSVRTW